MKALFLFFLPFMAWGLTSDGSILLHNDTTMILTAVIQASDGTFLGQFSVQPGQQKNFTTNMSPTSYQRPGTPNVSITPYTVIWQCPSEGIFSMCTNVSPGAYVKATICDGSHFCSPKKKIEKQAPASRLQKVK
ncbi:MAG: hypothetical protein K1X28_07210 [Parachlamydiales bacterium]|nr:hypothetical protein [Parachlamydiales bacterium]